MKPIRKPKTPLLAALQRTLNIAMRASRKNSPPADELLDMTKPGSYTRRKFLSDSAKAGMFVAAGSTILAACKKNNDFEDAFNGNSNNSSLAARNSQPTIVVVGAGMAGLNCAYQLKKNHYTNVTVYEGSTRAGGRMFTQSNVMAPGLTTEYGGEFIDSSHHDMLDLASEFGFSLIDTKDSAQLTMAEYAYYFNNTHYTDSDVINAFTPFAPIIEADIDSLPSFIYYNHPGNATTLDNTSLDQYLTNIGMTGWLRKLIDVAYNTEYGREINDQSSINFLYLFTDDFTDGFKPFGDSDERYKIRGGNQQLPNAIAANLGSQVIYDRKLTAVQQLTNGTYTLTFQQSNGGISTVSADIVVMAIPFTILRNVTLNVPLPSWKLNAINNLGYGTNAKLMIGFNNRQWNLQGYRGYAFTDQSFQNGWDSSVGQGSTSAGYTIFTGGNTGVALGSGTPQSQAAIHMPGFELCYPGSTAQMNGNITRAQWPTNPWSMASYACYRPGQFTTISGAEKQTVGNMVFCGEHCSYNWQGYMNGAASTGRLAAETVLDLIHSHA